MATHARAQPSSGLPFFFAAALCLASASLPACHAVPAVQLAIDPASAPSLAGTHADPETLCDPRTRSWDILSEGRTVATTRGHCRGKDERGWHFVSQLETTDATVPDYEFHLWLNDLGAPVGGQLRTPTVNTEFDWASGELVIARLGEQRVVSFHPEAPLWVTPAHSLYIRELMFRLGIGHQGTTFSQRSYIPEHDRISVLDFVLEKSEHGTAARSENGKFDLRGSATTLDDLEISSGRSGGSPLYRSQQTDTLTTKLPAEPAPHYLDTDDLKLENITIEGSPTRPSLAGEIVKRADEDASDRSRLRPGVVFLSGSGPQDRHGFVPGSPIDVGSHEIHDHLARAGYIVLRMDDRGVGNSELGPDVTPGYLDTVEDGRRAMNALAQYPGVDPKRIILIGHGEGALSAAKIASQPIQIGRRHFRLAGVVLLAAPGRTFQEVIYGEISAALALTDAETRARAIANTRRIHQAALANQELPAAHEPLRNWMVEIFKEDPIAAIHHVQSPVLALQGGKDFQIDPSADFDAVLAEVEAHGKRGSDTKLFADLDHLFKPEPGRSIPGHYADLGRRVDRDFLDYLRRWIDERVGL